MLAAQFEVQVSLAPGVTVFSAFIAVFFTWLALSSDAFTAKYFRRRRRKAKRLANQQRKNQHANSRAELLDSNGAALLQELSPSRLPSENAEEQPLLAAFEDGNNDELPSPPSGRVTNMKRDLNEACHLRAIAFDDTQLSRDSSDSRPPTPQIPPSDTPRDLITKATSNLANANAISNGRPPRSLQTSSRRPSLLSFARKWSSGQTTAKLTPTPSSTDLTDASSSSDKVHNHSHGATTPLSEGGDTSGGGTTASTPSSSFVRGLPLTLREKSRLKAGSGMVATPKELVLTLWGDCTIEAVAKSAIWAMAVYAIST